MFGYVKPFIPNNKPIMYNFSITLTDNRTLIDLKQKFIPWTRSIEQNNEKIFNNYNGVYAWMIMDKIILGNDYDMFEDYIPKVKKYLYEYCKYEMKVLEDLYIAVKKYSFIEVKTEPKLSDIQEKQFRMTKSPILEINFTSTWNDNDYKEMKRLRKKIDKIDCTKHMIQTSIIDY